MVELDSLSKARKRKCTEGLEEGAMPQKLKGHLKHCFLELDLESWTPNLDASAWPETVYYLEYRRADGSLAERIIKAEPFANSGSADLLPQLKIEAKVN
ncbi:hypothetical protein ACEPPN_017707 [Leptodophora sp. 'Broadleaf-Isolate-01']